MNKVYIIAPKSQSLKFHPNEIIGWCDNKETAEIEAKRLTKMDSVLFRGPFTVYAVEGLPAKETALTRTSCT